MPYNLFQGKSTSGGTVTVYWAGTTVKPTIYYSAAGGSASNPITAGVDGSYGFYAADGHYKIVNGTPTGDLTVKILSLQEGSPNAADISLTPFRSSTATTVESWIENAMSNPTFDGAASFLSGATFTGAAASSGLLGLTATAAATAPGSVRGAVFNCNPTTGAYSSGTLAGVRGAVTLAAGNVMTSTFMYGAQGKFIGGAGELVGGSAHIAGVLAQMDLASTTVTSGHVAPLIVSGQTLPASAYVNMIYAESGGNKINSVLQSNVACNFFLDVNNFENCGIIATPTGATMGGNLRTIKIQIDGATYYLLAAATVS